MSDNKLKNCPFCNNAKSVGIATEHDIDGFGVYYSVKCRACGASSQQKYCSNGEDCPQFYQEVRDCWNNRLADIHEEPIADLEQKLEEAQKQNNEMAREALNLFSMNSAPRVEDAMNPVLLKFKDDLSPYYGNFEKRMKRYEGMFIVGYFDGFDIENSNAFDTFGCLFGNGGFASQWFEGWLDLKVFRGNIQEHYPEDK